MGIFGGKKTQENDFAPVGHVNLQAHYHACLERADKPGTDQSILATEMADAILATAVRERASDIHVETHDSQLKVRLRVDGLLEDHIIGPSHTNIPLAVRLRIMSGFDPTPPKPFRSEDGRFDKNINGRTIQLRTSSFPATDGDRIVLRVIDQGIAGMPLDQIGLNADDLAIIEKMIQSNYGIVFVTGATGSGKTTTLYSILSRINKKEINIMTLEDPVEYRLASINQAQINLRNGFTFEEGLRVILRQDPNIIMVGEIRDAVTAEIAMRASLTGHLVLTTLHTVNATASLDRLLEIGIPTHLISSAVLGAIAQRLTRKLCTYCAEPTPAPSEAALQESFQWMNKEETDYVRQCLAKPTAQFKKPVGCPQCGNRGYLGRLGIFEIMTLNDGIRSDLFNKAQAGVLRRTAIQNGMRSLWMDGALKASQGLTTWEEIIRVAKTAF